MLAQKTLNTFTLNFRLEVSLNKPILGFLLLQHFFFVSVLWCKKNKIKTKYSQLLVRSHESLWSYEPANTL